MIFDLAEAWGCSAAEVELRTTDAELVEWCVRTESKPLWTTRLELMLAQVAQCVTQTAARKSISIREFLLFRDPGNAETNSPEENASMLAGIAGGVGVRVLGQGRKKKREVH